ncbi:MAG: prepilin-type N-terminal cleavage/methylation domain-containing protein [Verrucomicrobia bacterium]|nr:prepilin-type N-terminal cleavage/methylation domain-containing protein [Verrucomicrobiota bacterium]MCH8527624.1 prepilin-type N-terminal cleavage/methylation domain-containing protein [Kiritimatiellia bacterium]
MKTSKSGLTLLELVVVLAILALLSGLAMRSVTGLFEQSRYEQNERLMRDLEEALLGDAGFVRDMGRLPQATGTDPLTLLSELWEQGALPDYSLQTLSGVRIGGGWRGPYLRLPPGASGLRDAYGTPLAFFQPNGDPVDATGQIIARVVSSGGPLNDEIEILLPHAGFALPVQVTGATDSVGIQLFRIENGLVTQTEQAATAAPLISHNFLNVLPVPVVLRAVQGATQSLPVNRMHTRTPSLPVELILEP